MAKTGKYTLTKSGNRSSRKAKAEFTAPPMTINNIFEEKQKNNDDNKKGNAMKIALIVMTTIAVLATTAFVFAVKDSPHFDALSNDHGKILANQDALFRMVNDTKTLAESNNEMLKFLYNLAQSSISPSDGMRSAKNIVFTK